MGNPEGSLGGDWEGEEGGDADRRPLELRRLLLSGDVVVLRSGEGSGWDAGAGRVALPLRMSMTCGTLHDHLRASPAHTALPLSNSPGSRFLSLLAQGASPLPQDVQEGKSLLFFGPQSLLCLELTPMRQAAPARLHALTRAHAHCRIPCTHMPLICPILAHRRSGTEPPPIQP